MGYLNRRGNHQRRDGQFPGARARLWMGGTNLTSGLENEWAEMIASLFIYARNTQYFPVHADRLRTMSRMCTSRTTRRIRPKASVCTGNLSDTNALHCLAQQLDNNGMSDLRFVAPDSQTEFGYSVADDE